MALMVLLIAVFLAVAACFEGAETSLLSISEVRLQTLIKKGDERAVIASKLRQNVRTLLGTLLMGQTVCDIAAASLATLVAHGLMGESGVAIETVVMTIIVLIFVNLIPKSHAANNVERWTLAVARPVYLITRALGPLVGIIDRFVALFVRSKGAEVLVTEEEIKTMTHIGVTAGVVEHGEKELIDRVFLFNDITADDVLTPREIVIALDGHLTVSEALPIINSTKFSRFPVYEKSLDEIVGILHIKKVLEKAQEDPALLERTPLKELVAPAVFVPSTEPIDHLFRQFKKEHVHMAIVVNDARKVVGLVTLEDLIEELVGEISDESDVDEQTIKRVDKLTIIAHGDTDIPDINRFFNTRIEAGDERTIGRLIRSKLGRTPKQGQSVQVAEGVTATVEQISRGRTLRVRLTKVPAATGASA